VQIPRAPMDGAPSPKFGLSLLGGFELTGPDGVVGLPSKKLAGLGLPGLHRAPAAVA